MIGNAVPVKLGEIIGKNLQRHVEYSISKDKQREYQMQNPPSQNTAFSQFPEDGQMVEVRRRRWVVTSVNACSLTGRINETQHLVSLESLEEDALGEELQVIWELEAGAQVIQKAGLPNITGFDSNYRLDAFLNAVRWGAATNADRNSLQSPFRSGITIEDYQLDPLVRSLDMARVNLLIADDVGLGKTIEAGLVLQELLIRHRARTIFIICPAGLQLKWQDEMREKFGLDFRIVNTAYLRSLRRSRGLTANPWTSYPRLITSMDWIKSGEGLRLLKEVLPVQLEYPRKFDVLVIDEAHNVAPAAAAAYSLPSQRTQLIERLSPHFTHHLFLTATPHNGYKESFSSLLELLDNQRFAKTVEPNPEQLRQVMIRRMKSDILDKKGKPVFPKRVLKPLPIDYTDEEKHIHTLLKEYTQLREEQLGRGKFSNVASFVHILLKKRLFSSPAAFAKTLEKHRMTIASSSKRQMAGRLDERILHRAILRAEEEHTDEMEAEAAVNEAIEQAAEFAPALTPQQSLLLDELTNWANKHRSSEDSKAKAILDWLNDYLKPNGQWNDRRVILFTEYRDTHSWLLDILTRHGFAGEHLMNLHGGLLPDEREAVKAAFQASTQDSPVRILLATDAASEGIDLQNHCNYMIHVEIPWNPIVLEQRNGRIDRHGQTAEEVFIWHPVSSRYKDDIASAIRPGDIVGDSDYLMRTALKINSIREDLGSAGTVLSRQIEDAMLGKSFGLDTKAIDERRKRAARILGADKEQGNRIARLHETLLTSRETFSLSPENVRNAVQVALELAGKPPLEPVAAQGLPPDTVFTVPPLSGAWSQALVGLDHPHTHRIRPITFNHEAMTGRDDVVLAHLNHKLVQMSLRLLREEIWSLDDVKKLNRVAIRCVAGLTTPAVLVWQRIVVTGGDHHRLHEELTNAGGELRPDSFRRFRTRAEIGDILKRSEPQDTISKARFAILKQCFEANERSILDAIDSRSKERQESLKNTLQLRKENELRTIETILDDLAKNIQKELQVPAPERQLTFEFFNEMEKQQYQKDVNALRARLERIPEEKVQEKAVIERHYADAVPRTFPVAVVFFVPKTQEWGC